ncbi:cytochrome-c peroxidase [Oceanibium sediminis]|uniref:cytochrome-c peroxidase n=1 Tax=Oceanibium sediminis TaxID=2026339 RepID=UPI00351A566B
MNPLRPLLVVFALLGQPALGQPEPVADQMYRPVNRAAAEVGRLLFWDPVLSGNRNISCGTCHHPRFGTGDGLSLGMGEGGIGLGPERVADPENMPEERIPRNAPALFNLGAREFTVLFHDGRIEVDPSRPGGFRTPLEGDMMQGFDTLLSAQTMFPVLSQDEMAGHYSENEVSRAVRQGRLTGKGGAWDLIAARVRAIPQYVEMLGAAYPDIAAGREADFTDISNAIAAFMEFEWRSDSSPFDAALRGETPLSGPAANGQALFYGDAGCADCHAGPFLTDHRFHAMGAPQIGPGKAARFERHARDVGRMRVTGRDEDAFAFRTPSLRNVALTAPYGHAGAHRTLPGFLADHGRADWAAYDRAQAVLPGLEGMDDWLTLDDPAETEAVKAALANPAPVLSDADIAALVAFLESLSDPVARSGRLGIPQAVPSGLPLDR